MFGNQLRVPVPPPQAREAMRTERRNKEIKVELVEREQEVRFT